MRILYAFYFNLFILFMLTLEFLVNYFVRVFTEFMQNN